MIRRRLIARVGLVKVYRDAAWDEFHIVNPDNTTTYESDRVSAMGTATALARFFGVPSNRGRGEQPILMGVSFR